MLSASTFATVVAVLATADAQAAYGAPLPYGQAPAYNTSIAAVPSYGTAVSASASASASASTTASSSEGCYAKYDDCRVAPDANMAYCASQYAACLGYNPFTATPSAPVYYTTEIVTALTTYCPSATTLTHGTKTYTITSATTLTITDCPCTVTKPSYPTATPSTCDKQSVYNACIQSAVATGGSPNFAECNASSAGACQTTTAAATTATHPAASAPASSKPAASESVVSKPAASKPAVSQPAVSAPAASKPAASKPAVTTGCAVSQIIDGQPQAPGACTVVPAASTAPATTAPATTAASSKPVSAVSQIKTTTTGPRPAVYTGAAAKTYGSVAAVAFGAAMAMLA